MSTARRKGTAWESRLVAYFREHGFPHADRHPLRGTKDVGDISGIPLVVIEAKNQKEVTLAKWVDEARLEKERAGAQVAAVVFPRRNCATGRAYVLLELETFVELIPVSPVSGGLQRVIRGLVAELPIEAKIVTDAIVPPAEGWSTEDWCRYLMMCTAAAARLASDHFVV